jgi:hypothetical protein
VKTRQILVTAGMMGFMLLFWVHGGGAQNPPRGSEGGPVITHSFAVERGRAGFQWKIYLEAEDPAGEMDRIAAVVDQQGSGRPPADFVILRGPDRRHFKGYLTWNTVSSKAATMREWTSLVLRVSVMDKAGRESNEVAFPFTFESGVADPGTPPAPFDGAGLPKLGNLHFDLGDPFIRERMLDGRSLRDRRP